LSLSSRLTLAFSDGMHGAASELKKLEAKLKFWSAGSSQMDSCTMPVRTFLEQSNCSSLVMLESCAGRVPTRTLPLTSMTVVFCSIPISSGMHPSSLLLSKLISSSVLAILPMLLGMHPVSPLLATTTTDAVELPRFSGMWPTKRLVLTKMASRSLSKRPGGSSPSKSLNLMSRYLSEAISRQTKGKGPTKRLLLASNSWRMDSRDMLLGMMPQKRLVLMWKKARSVRRPSSGGRYPAMSAPLRSMPATTVILGSSRASVQMTPL
jgi:hypothetical protein